LSYYEEFIFTSRAPSEYYATQTPEKITVINESILFKKEIGEKEIIDIEDINESKNYALSASFELRHEKNDIKIEHKKILIMILLYFLLEI